MTTDRGYLLHDDEQAHEFQEKIRNLLESNETNTIEVALQLLQGGGVPASMHTHLAVLHIFHQKEDIRKKAKKLLKKTASSSLLAHIEKNAWNPFHLYEYHERDMDKYLREITNHKHLDKAVFANFTLKITNKGALFCLKNKTASAHFILNMLINNDSLSMDYFDLEELPEAIGDFKQLRTLSLEGNPLKKLPNSLAYLVHLEFLYFSPDLISAEALTKLEAFFPKIMAQRYYDEAWQLVNNLSYEDALESIEKSCLLNPLSHVAWDTQSWILTGIRAYPRAIECLEKALLITEDDSEKAQYHASQSTIYLRLGKQAEAEKEANTALQYLVSIPQIHWRSDHFFCKGQAMYSLRNFEEAHLAYDSAIHMEYHYGGGACWYNKACIYAHQKQKENMLDALQKALEAGRIYWAREAPLDNDFQAYLQDEDFLNILKA